MDEVNKLRAQVSELKAEVSGVGRLHELRGRELTAARKKVAKSESLEPDLKLAEEKIEALKKALAYSERSRVELQIKLDRVDRVLADVAALKRLVG